MLVISIGMNFHEKKKNIEIRKQVSMDRLTVKVWDHPFNISTWRKSGLASNPLFIIPGFFLHFSLELSYGYLRFEGNGKIPWGR